MEQDARVGLRASWAGPVLAPRQLVRAGCVRASAQAGLCGAGGADSVQSGLDGGDVGERGVVVEGRVADDVARVEFGARTGGVGAAGGVDLGWRGAGVEDRSEGLAHVLPLGDVLSNVGFLDDFAELVVLPGIGVVSGYSADQLLQEHLGGAGRVGSVVLGVEATGGVGCLLEQADPGPVHRIGVQGGLLHGDGEGDLGGAAGQAHLLGDSGDGAGHLHLLVVQGDAGVVPGGRRCRGDRRAGTGPCWWWCCCGVDGAAVAARDRCRRGQRGRTSGAGQNDDDQHEQDQAQEHRPGNQHSGGGADRPPQHDLGCLAFDAQFAVTGRPIRQCPAGSRCTMRVRSMGTDW